MWKITILGQKIIFFPILASPPPWIRPWYGFHTEVIFQTHCTFTILLLNSAKQKAANISFIVFFLLNKGKGEGMNQPGQRLLNATGLIWFLVFNATFSNISAKSWRPVLMVEEAGVPGENHRSWAGNWYLRLRVECTVFVIYKARREPTPYWL